VVGHLGEVINVQTQKKLLRSEAVSYQLFLTAER